MPKLTIIKNSKEFKKIYNHQNSFANKFFVIYILKNQINKARFGYSISKKVGTAVERNRIRRILKEICRLNMAVFEPGFDYVIIVRPYAKNITFKEAEEYLLKLNYFLKNKIKFKKG